MKKIFITLILFSLLIFKNAYSATGEATEYIVTMKKVELCEDSACATSYTIGDSSMDADIAAANAGATVGSYASTSGIPAGKTYTHLRVTLSRTFTITGTVEFTGDDCATDGGSDASATQLLDAGTGTAASTSMYLSNADTYGSDDGKGEDGGTGITMSYSSPTYASTMTVSGDTAVMIYELTAPYGKGLKAHLIYISFNTENAIGAFDNTNCIMWAEEPFVSITIK